MTHNVILGIGQTHNATACLLVDGHLTACASEDLNRQKNTTAFPVEAALRASRRAVWNRAR